MQNSFGESWKIPPTSDRQFHHFRAPRPADKHLIRPRQPNPHTPTQIRDGIHHNHANLQLHFRIPIVSPDTPHRRMAGLASLGSWASPGVGRTQRSRSDCWCLVGVHGVGALRGSGPKATALFKNGLRIRIVDRMNHSVGGKRRGCTGKFHLDQPKYFLSGGSSYVHVPVRLFSCFGTSFAGGSEDFLALPSQGHAGGSSVRYRARLRTVSHLWRVRLTPKLKKMVLYPGDVFRAEQTVARNTKTSFVVYSKQEDF